MTVTGCLLGLSRRPHLRTRRPDPRCGFPLFMPRLLLGRLEMRPRPCRVGPSRRSGIPTGGQREAPSDTLASDYPWPSGCLQNRAAPEYPEDQCQMAPSCPTPWAGYPRLFPFPRILHQPRPRSRTKNPRNQVIELKIGLSYNIVGGVPLAHKWVRERGHSSPSPLPPGG
jgi:hypothetical protein